MTVAELIRFADAATQAGIALTMGGGVRATRRGAYLQIPEATLLDMQAAELPRAMYGLLVKSGMNQAETLACVAEMEGRLKDRETR